jgi:hypothetical protein
LLPNRNEYLIDTDVLEEHLIHNSDKSNSYLELLMQKGICFSTVLNAAELLYKSISSIEQKIVIDLLSVLKILGLHSRYSLLVPKYSILVKNINEALFCVVADYNKLPIVTLKKSKYLKSGLLIYHPKELLS